MPIPTSSSRTRRRPPHGRAVRRLAALGAVVALLAVAGCTDGGDDATGDGGEVGPAVTLPDQLATTTTGGEPVPGGGTAPSTDDPVGGPSSGCGLCLTVEAPLRCQGDTVAVTARWADRGGTRAGILVDGKVAPGDVAPAGPFDLDVPCDGRAHTVVLVVTLPGGGTEQSSAAVRSSPGS
jgi:hypothetical protein